MEALVEQRRTPVGDRLEKIRHRHSMLHLDVLMLIYHFASTSSGTVLEIGPYLGGSTIAAALGIRRSGKERRLLSIEPGGQHKHHRLPSRDILRDLRKNLSKQGVADLVTVLQGYSWKEEIAAAVERQVAAQSVGLLMIDADGDVQRDLARYRQLLSPGCSIVIDDYLSRDRCGKELQTRPQVDALVAAGKLQPLGIYGWGTWVGRWSDVG